MERSPLAFMSYVHADDKYGHLTTFCERLSDEVQVQTGEPFPIFQDRKDIYWGDAWRDRLENSLDEVTFLLPIITPSYFKSEFCRIELQRFIDREKQLGRNDLILPVYYVECATLSNSELRLYDELAQIIASRQYADWREFRFEPFTSPQVGKMLEKLAVQIRDALQRVQPTNPIVLPSTLLETQLDTAIGTSQTETVHKPVAKTEPPMRVVDPLHRGDHVTISEAIEAAQPGDRILVRPGLYQEGLVINKPLEIIGDGEPGDVVVQATGQSTLLFKTTMGRIANLTLRQMDGGDCCCVDITQGRLELEDCDITSNSLSCVAIHDTADPRLKRSRIRNGKTNGIYIYEKGLGTIEDNDIFGNTLSGVEITTGANPTLRRNRIYEGKKAGVVVRENGLGTLEGNDIFGNAVEVGIETGGNPTLRHNRIHNSKSSGIVVRENGLGTLEGNDIFGTTKSAVVIMTGGNPTLSHNRIHDSQQRHGVSVHDNGQGTLEENDIFNNAIAGVAITTGGNPTLRRNRIYDGKASGVFVYENGQGTLEDNDIFGNAYSGVEIKTGSNPMLRRNRINRNASYAVYVHNKGGGTIEDNDLRNNEKEALQVSENSESNLKRNNNLE